MNLPMLPDCDLNPLSARLCSDTSYARHKDNGQWYYFDDSKVTFAAEDLIVVSISVRFTPPPGFQPSNLHSCWYSNVGYVSVLLQTSAAYVLFYQRQDKIRKPTLPTPNASPASTAQLANDIASCRDDAAELGSGSCYITMETD